MLRNLSKSLCRPLATPTISFSGSTLKNSTPYHTQINHDKRPFCSNARDNSNDNNESDQDNEVIQKQEKSIKIEDKPEENNVINADIDDLVETNDKTELKDDESDKEIQESEEEPVNSPKNQEKLPSNTKFPTIVGHSIRSRSRANEKTQEDDLKSLADFCKQVPVIAVRRPFLPGFHSLLTISLEFSVKLYKDKSKNVYFAAFMADDADQTDNNNNNNNNNNINNNNNPDYFGDLNATKLKSKIGTLVKIENMVTAYMQGFGYGTQTVLKAIARVKMEGEPILKDGSYEAKIQILPENEYDKESAEAKALSAELFTTISEFLNGSAFLRKQISGFRLNEHDLSNLADWPAANFHVPHQVVQKTLEQLDVIQRARDSLALLDSEVEMMKVRHRIHQLRSASQIQNKQTLAERIYQVIKKEMGVEMGFKDAFETQIDTQLAKVHPPEAVMTAINESREKLRNLEQNASEYTIVRNHLTALTKIPWGVYTTDTLDLDHAEVTLNKHHYGLKSVKERVIQFIAIGIIKEKITQAVSDGKIICLVGPPGVGKTSIGKSIAAAVGRKYYRFSVGGMNDVSEIKGHRRTYVGAMPGKIINGLIQVQSSNPVFVIDEIDKFTQSHHGDPAAALLEVLDPEQNKEFVDHYIDLPVDLSNVLFVCTANSTSTIPAPLLDRMEVIEVSGYTPAEKIHILQDYLLEKSSRASGVPVSHIDISAVISPMIEFYCREPGVRILQQTIESIFRQAAVKLAKKEISEENKLVITPTNLRKFLGAPQFSVEKAFVNAPPGVVLGLSYTGMGGSVLILETVAHGLKEDGNPDAIKLTGMLGQVITESASIAENFVKILLRAKQPDNKFFTRHSINVHLPNGAIKKDGPSAGIALSTALISLATGRSVDYHLAMTGEITLTGRVLVVGGIKEKALGAQRAGVKRLILPFDNRFDWEELDEPLKDHFEQVFFVKNYEEVYEFLFGSGAEPLVNKNNFLTFPSPFELEMVKVETAKQ